MEIKHNERNFPYTDFKDYYGHSCSLQLSSIVEPRCIWLGIDDAQPKVLASEAHLFGIKTDVKTGWIDFPVPPNVLLSTHMHLSLEQVQELLPILQRFVETGDIVE